MLKKSNKTILPIIALALFFLSFSIHLEAQAKGAGDLPENVPALLVKVNEAYAAGDYMTFRMALQKIHSMRPYNSDYMYQLVVAHALLDEKSAAYDLMLRMQQQGLSYDFTATENTMNIRNTEVFDYVNDLMVMAGQPLGKAEPVFTLPGNVVMPEAISWDESRQKLLIGTVAEGSILAVGEDGQVTELIKADETNGLWAIFDILVDSVRNRLWVTTAASAKFSGFDATDQGRSALYEFNLETLEIIHRYPVPVDGKPHSLGNMVMNPGGDIFIVDRALPFVYSKPAGQGKLKAMLASREMISMRGIAMQPDGRIMYVADRELGILVVDLEAGRAGKLVVPDTLNLAGIEGLSLWKNHLVIIQNGIKPQRIMRLQLDSTGTQVTAIRPLAVALPEFDYPSYGTVRGNDLYYFANSQWAGGNGDLKPVTVVRTALDSSGDLEQPDMQDFLNQRGEKLKARQGNPAKQ